MNEIKKWRTSAGMTQREMALKFEIPLRSIENWEGEKTKPPSYVEQLIVEKLKIMAKQRCSETKKERINMHINMVKINEYYVSYDIENVKTVDKKGKEEERVQIVATFKKDGEVIHRVYNISNSGCEGIKMAAKLLDRDFAKNKALEIINDSNKSTHSPFLN